MEQKIQILVATSTLAWGVNTPAHLVVIKGTEFYDAPTRRYVDFPITDVLQVGWLGCWCCGVCVCGWGGCVCVWGGGGCMLCDVVASPGVLWTSTSRTCCRWAGCAAAAAMYRAAQMYGSAFISPWCQVPGVEPALQTRICCRWAILLPHRAVKALCAAMASSATCSLLRLPAPTQMMGRAGRPQYDRHGVAVIMVHEPKKQFYKRFLYEPFPVESSLADQVGGVRVRVRVRGYLSGGAAGGAAGAACCRYAAGSACCLAGGPIQHVRTSH